MDASEFYRLRDDRTNACGVEPAYARRRVAISIDEAAAADVAGQITFALAVNLTARWCRCLRVAAPGVSVDARLRMWADGELANAAVQIARRADPFGDFEVGNPTGDDWIRLHVGGGAAPAGAYRLGSDGWIALAGDAVAIPKDACAGHPLAAAMASCIGTAWAFRAAVGEIDLPSSARLSMWNLQAQSLASRGLGCFGDDLGSILMVGCGAVGSAIAYLLPVVGVSATIDLVDGDTVDVTNLNRSPLFFFGDLEESKARVTTAFLRRAGFPAEAIAMWFDEALAERLVFQNRPDVVIPAANERNVRHAIQHQAPPLMVYGTTSRDWQAFLGRHIPLQEDCLVCRFPRTPPPGAPPLTCATGRVANTEPTQPGVDAALPFVSTGAAILAIAELIKASRFDGPINPNFACLDFRGSLDHVMTDQRNVRIASCICQPQRAAWSILNGATKHRRLSDTEAKRVNTSR